MGNAKGAVLVGPVKFLRKRRDEAFEILGAEHHHYLREVIRLSGWYPERDFVALVRAAARLILPGDQEQAIEQMGYAGALEHGAIYGDLLQSLESNSSVFALWSIQHDTGQMRGIPEGSTASRIQLIEFDSPSREICLLTRGYIRAGIAENGRQEVAVDELHCRLNGDDRCEWRVRWKGNH